MPKTKDYYEALGVARTASEKEIQGAFRKLARKFHPDVNQNDKEAERRFKEASQAHDVLSDPEKRRYYDAFGDQWQAAQSAGVDPAAGAAGFGGQGRGRAGYRTVDPRDLDDLFGGAAGGTEGFGDLFGSLFGGNGRRGRAAARPAEVEGTVPITLREAYQGTKRTVTVPDGRTLEVTVPAGVSDGTILKVPGLRARVEIAPDPVFQREGRDLRTAVTVPLRDALLGAEVMVPTPRGTSVQLTVPPETQNGTRLRLRGLGMPDPKGGAAGDLYAEVRVRLPVPLDEGGKAWAQNTPG